MCFSWQEAGVLHCGLQMTRRALTAVGSDLKVRKVTARKVFSHIKPNFRNNYGCILSCFFSGVHRSHTGFEWGANGTRDVSRRKHLINLSKFDSM